MHGESEPEACTRETWMSKAKAISLVCTSVTGSVAAIIAAVIGLQNQGGIEKVREKQDVQVEKAEQRDTKIDKIETASVKVAKDLQDTLGPQLFLTWKQLEAIAEMDPTKENAAKSDEAKAAYLAHVRKK